MKTIENDFLKNKFPSIEEEFRADTYSEGRYSERNGRSCVGAQTDHNGHIIPGTEIYAAQEPEPKLKGVFHDASGKPVMHITSNETEVQRLIKQVCGEVCKMLLDKNAAYGNSALDPVRCFSKVPRDEQIRVRLDDKISRLMRGSAAGEDVEKDIMGYLVLLEVSRRITETGEAKTGIP